MRKTKIGSTYYLTIGLLIFPVGLLMLLRQPTLIDLISNIMPSVQTVEIFGLILQFLGEGLICYGIIGAISGKVNTNADYNRQIVMAGVNRTVQDQIAGVSRSLQEHIATVNKNMEGQISTLHYKLNQMEQKSTVTQLPAAPANCKFCGAKINQGRFCPSCGKAN